MRVSLEDVRSDVLIDVSMGDGHTLLVGVQRTDLINVCVWKKNVSFSEI